MHSSKKGKLIKFILFFALLILVNAFLKLALIDDVSMRNNISRCISNRYDIVFVGTSQLRSGLNPEVVSDVTGKSVTNAAIPLSSPIDQYYFIKEICLSGNKPECIVYECDPYYFTEGKAGGHSYAYPLGFNRMEYFVSGLQQDWRAVMTSWSFQWMNYNMMPSVISKKIKYFEEGYDTEYNGFAPTDAPFKAKNIVDREYAVTDMADEYLQKICEYCNENEIELILVHFPVAKQVYDDMEPNYRKGADSYYRSVSDRYGIGYINCNEWPNEIFDRGFDTFVDMEGHIRVSSTEKFSKIIGEEVLGNL